MNKMEMIRILNSCISRLDNMTIEDDMKVDISFIEADLIEVIWELEDEKEKEG